MKKSIKFICLILTVFVVCLSLSGCNMIKELRKDFAYYTKEGIKLGEKEYIQIKVNDYFMPEVDLERVITVAEKEVPLLLGGFYGKTFDISIDKVFITDYSKTYCLASEYQRVKDVFENPYKVNGYAVKGFDEENNTEILNKFSDGLNREMTEILSTEPLFAHWREYEKFSLITMGYSYGEEDYLKREEFNVAIYNGEYVIVTSIDDDGNVNYYKCNESFAMFFDLIL